VKRQPVLVFAHSWYAAQYWAENRGLCRQQWIYVDSIARIRGYHDCEYVIVPGFARRHGAKDLMAYLGFMRELGNVRPFSGVRP
jgi:hypothetical protein